MAKLEDRLEALGASVKWIAKQPEAKPLIEYLKAQIARVPYKSGRSLDDVAHRDGQRRMALSILELAEIQPLTPETDD